MRRARHSFMIEGFVQSLVGKSESEEAMSPAVIELLEGQGTIVRQVLQRLPKASKNVYLLSIVGTVSPLPFVADHLFQAVVTNMESVLMKHYPNNEKFRAVIEETAKKCPEVQEAMNSDKSALIAAVKAHLEENAENKSRPRHLDDLIFLILSDYYATGSVEGHVFEDAARAIQKWGSKTQEKSMVAVFSDLSVELQALHFQHSNHGDLTPYISLYFDSKTIGSKLEPLTYGKIRRELQEKMGTSDFNIIFLTSKTTEVISARASERMDAVFYIMRPLNERVTLDTFFAMDANTASSFDQLIDDSWSKDSLPSTCAEVAPYVRSKDEN